MDYMWYVIFGIYEWCRAPFSYNNNTSDFKMHRLMRIVQNFTEQYKENSILCIGQESYIVVVCLGTLHSDDLH